MGLQTVSDRPGNFTDDWIAIAETINWLRQDPLLDWLELYGRARGFKPDSDFDDYIPDADFDVFIKKKGREFEDRVIGLLDARLAKAGHCPSDKVAEEASHSDRLKQTIALMQRGTPVICQGFLASTEFKAFGSPDLLIRSDVLHLLTDSAQCPQERTVGALEISSESWHYVCADIKFSTLLLDSNREIGNDKAHYKVQLGLYNEALAEVQGYRPKQAFVLARGWKKGSGERLEERSCCLDCFIPVSLPEQPQFRKDAVDWVKRGVEAIGWLRRVRVEGSDWQVLPEPTNTDLRPNMKNHRDSPWHNAKREIAVQIGEPTVIWYLGVEDRNRLVGCGFDDWQADGFQLITADSTKPTGQRQIQMLEINRSGERAKCYPVPLQIAREEWERPEPIEFYVDFETTSDLDDDFSRLPDKGGQPLIFMIGCGHFEPIEEAYGSDPFWQLHPERRQWNFRCFTTADLTEAEEKTIIMDWYLYMREVSERMIGEDRGPRVFHWSPAETRTYSTGLDSAYERHLRPSGWPEPNWYDFLARVVKPSGSAEAFYVKRAWGFGLKAIGKALYKLGYIETEWKDGPADGLAAMGGAWACYRIAEEKGVPVNAVRLADRANRERAFFEEVMAYNETDCKVMAEAIQALRKLNRDATHS